jgi:hypothetical protein
MYVYIYIYNSIYIHIIYTINPNVKPVKLEFTKLPCHYLAILYLVYLDQTVANRDAGAQSTSALIISATLGAGPHRGWSGDKVWKKQICVDFFLDQSGSNMKNMKDHHYFLGFGWVQKHWVPNQWLKSIFFYHKNDKGFNMLHQEWRTVRLDGP